MHNLIVQPGTTTTTSVDQKLLEPVLGSLSKMTPRDSLRSCIKTLHDSPSIKFKLLAVTNGGLESTKNYFYKAFDEEGEGNGKELVEKVFEWSFLSCDELRIAKPDQKVYENVWNKLKEQGLDERKGWFVASHTWDLHAAKKAG